MEHVYILIRIVLINYEEVLNFNLQNETLRQYVCHIVNLFHYTDSVSNDQSSGRPTVLSEEVVENIQYRMKVSGNKSLMSSKKKTLLFLTSHKRIAWTDTTAFSMFGRLKTGLDNLTEGVIWETADEN